MPDSISRLFVVVPVFDEAANLPNLMQSFRTLTAQIRQCELSIILVDDGSRDGTAATARQLAGNLQLTVLSHERNRGPGAAFGTAFDYLAERLTANDWVATIEGDNTSRHEILNQMLTRTREGYDVVLASPYMYGGGIANTSLLRMLLSHFGNGFIKESLGIHGILTMSSFYRLYRASTILDLQRRYGRQIVERAGFESMIELLLKMIYSRTRISEVPMVLDTSRRQGRSKMKIIRTIRGYLTLWKDKRRWMAEANR